MGSTPSGGGCFLSSAREKRVLEKRRRQGEREEELERRGGERFNSDIERNKRSGTKGDGDGYCLHTTTSV